MFISVQPHDVSLDNLVCLAQALQRRHRNWTSVEVDIFESEFAAAVYNPGWTMSAPGLIHDRAGRAYTTDDIYQLLRARYVLTRSAKVDEEYLEILPLGLEYWDHWEGSFMVKHPIWPNKGQDFRTRIEFPLTAAPRCRFELNHRCLLALAPLRYPWEERQAQVSGMVTLTGRVTRDGKVADVAVADRPAGSLDAAESLVRAAVEHLQTMRFESAPHEDGMRITYTYTIDPALPRPDLLDVKLTLPDQVTIRAAPVK